MVIHNRSHQTTSGCNIPFIVNELTVKETTLRTFDQIEDAEAEITKFLKENNHLVETVSRTSAVQCNH